MSSEIAIFDLRSSILYLLEGVGQERRVGDIGLPPVPQRQVRAADDDLADAVHRHLLAGLVTQ